MTEAPGAHNARGMNHGLLNDLDDARMPISFWNISFSRSVWEMCVVDVRAKSAVQAKT